MQETWNKLIVTGVPENGTYQVAESAFGAATVYTVTVKSINGEEMELTKLKLAYAVYPGDVAGRWYPAGKQLDRAPHNSWEAPIATEFVKNAPIVSYYRNDDANRLTVALSDTFTPWRMYTGLCDGTMSLEFKAIPKGLRCGEYQVRVFVDVSSRPWYEAVQAARDFWASLHGAPYIPEAAYDPVYSTWYAYQEDLTQEDVLRQCRLAKALGCGSVFVDHGWTTPWNVPRFSDVGDWIPEPVKFPDIREMVRQIHDLGMKVVFWIAPCYAGVNSAAAGAFAGKFLYKTGNAYVLDPRYPEVRRHMIDSLRRVAEDYGLDGLKIDFIDLFFGEDAPLAEGRDFVSVAAAVRALLGEIQSVLLDGKSDFLIEYRQVYTAPELTRTGNILRSTDCPQDWLANRVNTIDLRLAGNTAVHADMIQFCEEEPPEISALQLTNILFCTPQVSVKLEKISEAQRKMLRFWLGFMGEKRALLQQGSLAPKGCIGNYTSVTAASGTEQCTALYGEKLWTMEAHQDTAYVVNARDRSATYVMTNCPGEYDCEVRNCMGEVQQSGTRKLDGVPQPVLIPYNGMLILRKKMESSSNLF